ncbi:unnamed protein product [Closterium sp. NIES-65]|nr:unnamed protein product [Closterium sp. NIES-65]
MELCTGGDLLELIQKQPNAFLSEAESCHVFTSVARAVKQCHANSIVHRDIKPENILICPTSNSVPAVPAAAAAAAADNGTSFSYTAKLADFGLAVDVPWWQQIRGYAGSKPYEAPEVKAGVAYDESADIWSLGVTLYAMLSGKWPLFSGGKRVLDEKADFASDDWKHVSGDAKDLIRRMLCVDVNERFTIDERVAPVAGVIIMIAPDNATYSFEDADAAFGTAVAFPHFLFPHFFLFPPFLFPPFLFPPFLFPPFLFPPFLFPHFLFPSPLPSAFLPLPSSSGLFAS